MEVGEGERGTDDHISNQGKDGFLCYVISRWLYKIVDLISNSSCFLPIFISSAIMQMQLYIIAETVT